MKALANTEIERLQAEPQLALNLLLPEDDSANDSSVIDLDKSWHGIHYLLTGTAWEGEPPLNVLVAGGTSLPDPDEEWGYGPPRLLRPGEIAAVNRALDALSDQDLSGRFDPADMTAKGIYPEIWDRDPQEDDALVYLMEYVSALRDFIRTANANQHGLVLAIV